MAESNLTPITRRRSTRQIKPSIKAKESMTISKLKDAGFVAPPSSSSDEEFYFFKDDVDDKTEKPKLLHENDVVHGEDIFAFQMKKHKPSLTLKAVQTQKTPHLVRTKMRSRILQAMREDSESEYNPSSDYESSELEDLSNESKDSSNSSVSEKEGNSQIKKPKEKIKFTSAETKVSSRARRIKANSKYTIDTDEYFANYASKKIKTSNNTLEKLQTPRLPQYELQKLLSNMTLAKEHKGTVKRLAETNKHQFKKWLYVLNENFSILLYGLGSKKNILSSFCKEHLQDMPVIVINGFFPTLSIKNILDSIMVDLLEISENPPNPNDACNWIIKEFNNLPDSHLYLIVHNIDGETLRNGKTQSILARLAAVENIHLIATIDHINAPLIWDHNKLSKFNYVWWDVTSFLPYTEETSFEKSMMVQQSGTLALSSLRNVFLSLTQNSKALYLKIANHQIENSGQYYQGIAFKDLYMRCRESFIASSDLALRAQLSEFIDHKMVKTKRSTEDGTEYLVIPLANGLLQKFLEEN